MGGKEEDAPIPAVSPGHYRTAGVDPSRTFAEAGWNPFGFFRELMLLRLTTLCCRALTSPKTQQGCARSRVATAMSIARLAGAGVGTGSLKNTMLPAASVMVDCALATQRKEGIPCSVSDVGLGRRGAAERERGGEGGSGRRRAPAEVGAGGAGGQGLPAVQGWRVGGGPQKTALVDRR